MFSERSRNHYKKPRTRVCNYCNNEELPEAATGQVKSGTSPFLVEHGLAVSLLLQHLLQPPPWCMTCMLNCMHVRSIFLWARGTISVSSVEDLSRILVTWYEFLHHLPLFHRWWFFIWVVSDPSLEIWKEPSRSLIPCTNGFMSMQRQKYIFPINMCSVNLSLFLFSWVIQKGQWIILNYLYYIIVYSKAIGIFMLEWKKPS